MGCWVRHFLDSADIGTVTVRYVVEPAGEARTRVRIDAIFVEDPKSQAYLRLDGTFYNQIQTGKIRW